MQVKLTTVRSDSRDQAEKFIRFLNENSRTGVVTRSETQLSDAIASGLATYFEEDGVIVGTGCVYEYTRRGFDSAFFELGSSIITRNGFGLQVFSAQMRIINITKANGERRYPIFSVVERGYESEHNLVHHVRMKDWVPSAELISQRGVHGLPFSNKKRVLIADEDAIELAHSNLKSLYTSQLGVFNTKKGGGKIFVGPELFDPGMLDLG